MERCDLALSGLIVNTYYLLMEGENLISFSFCSVRELKVFLSIGP